jgi:hypothetical protein
MRWMLRREWPSGISSSDCARSHYLLPSFSFFLGGLRDFPQESGLHFVSIRHKFEFPLRLYHLPMSWLKPNLRSSIYGLLGNPGPPSDSTLESRSEDIREAMLALLGGSGPKQFPALTRRIRYAADIQALWYLRGDLMAAQASLHGEKTARENIGQVTQLFKGLLPGSLDSRPSPLVG